MRRWAAEVVEGVVGGEGPDSASLIEAITSYLCWCSVEYAMWNPKQISQGEPPASHRIVAAKRSNVSTQLPLLLTPLVGCLGVILCCTFECSNRKASFDILNIFLSSNVTYRDRLTLV